MCAGGKDQQERTETIQRFKDGRADVLCATDIAAKGLDFDGAPLRLPVPPPPPPRPRMHDSVSPLGGPPSGRTPSTGCSVATARRAWQPHAPPLPALSFGSGTAAAWRCTGRRQSPMQSAPLSIACS